VPPAARQRARLGAQRPLLRRCLPSILRSWPRHARAWTGLSEALGDAQAPIGQIAPEVRDESRGRALDLISTGRSTHHGTSRSAKGATTSRTAGSDLRRLPVRGDRPRRRGADRPGARRLHQVDRVPDYFASAELYDPASGTFAPAGSMSAVRHDATATLLPNGQVLVAGGYDSSGPPLGSGELYAPTGNTFRSVVMVTPRGGQTATRLSDGRVLVVGGSGATEPGFEASA